MTTLHSDDFLNALDKDDGIEVWHAAPEGDHRWRLNLYEKINLRSMKKAGTLR